MHHIHCWADRPVVRKARLPNSTRITWKKRVPKKMAMKIGLSKMPLTTLRSPRIFRALISLKI